MGLCLLVYSLGQRALRHALVEADQTISNQLGQPTQRPTLRWVFQCFQDVHLLLVTGVKQIANLTEERRWILRFLAELVVNTICLSKGCCWAMRAKLSTVTVERAECGV